MFKRIVLVALLLSAATAAFGQAVQQSGSVTPNTAAIWNSTGVIKGGVTATDSPLNSFGVTRDGVDAFCVSSARSTAVGRNQLCFQAATSGPAKISLQNYGIANAQDLQFVLNGVSLTLPSGGGTFVTASGPFVANHVANFLNTSGVIQDSGLGVNAGVINTGSWAATPIPVLYGGTGSTTAADARTAFGLGTLALQNSGTVAITGGTITGMPSPSGSSDVATKGYVDGVAAGLIILAPSTLATAAVLPNTPTYSNGASGVGATLTAGSNTTLTVDGTAAPLATVVLVKNQVSTFQNGIYTVTQAGSGGAPWILTRATYFDTAAEMIAGSYTFVTGGATLSNSSYTLQSTVATVGTNAVTFVLFSQVSAGVTSIAGNAGAFLLGSGLNNSGNTLLNNGVLSIAGNIGAFTLSNGLTNSTNDIRLASLANGKMLANTSGSSAAPSETRLPYMARATATFVTDATSSTATVYQVTLTAPGGGGGGANGSAAYGGGGAAGGTCKGYFTGVAAGATVTITTPIGGVGGVGATGSTGSTGTSATIAATGITTITATGGTGGGGGGTPTGQIAAGGTGGTCSTTSGTGIVFTAVPGANGGPGVASASGAGQLGGYGGGSFWGGGAPNPNNGLGTCLGAAGQAPGSGGAGSCIASGTGGAGAAATAEVMWMSVQ